MGRHPAPITLTVLASIGVVGTFISLPQAATTTTTTTMVITLVTGPIQEAGVEPEKWWGHLTWLVGVRLLHRSRGDQTAALVGLPRLQQDRLTGWHAAKAVLPAG